MLDVQILLCPIGRWREIRLPALADEEAATALLLWTAATPFKACRDTRTENDMEDDTMYKSPVL